MNLFRQLMGGTCLLLIVIASTVHAATFYAYERQQQTLVTINSVTGDVTTVGPTGIFAQLGGLSIDQEGNLYWLGSYSDDDEIPPSGLFLVDKYTGNFSLIGNAFDIGLARSTDGFTIIGDAGYTMRHEQNNTLAQLYEIDLSNGIPSKIGSGYSINGNIAEKTLGLTTDGVDLYGILGSGQVEKLNLTTGQVDSVVGNFEPVGTYGPSLAYTEGKFWSTEWGSPESALYSLDPSDGTVTLVQDNIPTPLVISLTATSYSIICPDLVVSDIIIDPPQPSEGQPVTLLVTVRNQGIVDADTFNIDWYADRVTPPSVGEVGDERIIIASLQVGASHEWGIDWVYSVSGDYTMSAQADTDNWIPECDEENNVVMVPIYVGEEVGDDTDGDGVGDESDNCIEVANADQFDTDADGYGNLCDGDLNDDGATNTLDLNLYKQAHRTSLGDADYDVDADFNGDGTINTLDLNIYKGLHRKLPGPSCCAP